MLQLLYGIKKERRPCPWLTDNLLQCVRDRKQLHRLLMRDTTNDVLREQHRTARAMARSLGRKLRNQYFMSQCSTSDSDQRKLWSVMNTVTGRKRSHSAPQVPPDQLSDVFGDVVNDPTRLNLKLPTGPMSSSAFTVFVPVTIADVTKCLVCVDPMKAMGSDDIPGIVLKIVLAVFLLFSCKSLTLLWQMELCHRCTMFPTSVFCSKMETHR